MTLLYGQNALVAHVVSSIIPGESGQGFPENSTAIGVVHNDQIVGGVVYHDWNPEAGTIEMSTGSIYPRWLTKKNVSEFLAYPFEGCGCQMILTRASVENKRAVKLNLGLGFTPQTIPRLYGEHIDGILFRLTREDWQRGKFCRNEVKNG